MHHAGVLWQQMRSIPFAVLVANSMLRLNLIMLKVPGSSIGGPLLVISCMYHSVSSSPVAAPMLTACCNAVSEGADCIGLLLQQCT